MSDIQKEIKKLSRLKQFKNKDKSTIERLAQLNVWRRQLNLENRFDSTEDKNLAKSIFDNYLQNFEFQSFTDIQNVGDLVYEEVLKENIQKEISKITADKNTKFVPDKLISSMHDVESRIWELKEKAGIIGKKEQDDLTALQELEKKFKTYIAFNRNEFTAYLPVVCKQCGNKNVEPVLLRRRVKDFDILKHPFFAGRFYYNRRGIELVKANIWTKEQYAWAFHTSPKFVTWCIENEHKIVEVDEVEEKEIQEFINNTDYLKKENIPDKISNNKRK